MESLQYPIGRFQWPLAVSADEIQSAIDRIGGFAHRMHDAVAHLNDDQLDTPYRAEGWTIRQVVHHCADSHANAYVRFKWALTEETPTIKVYDQSAWAQLNDSNLAPGVSVKMLEAVHQRWVALMRSMSDADWDRGYVHPEYGKVQLLRQVVMMYAWHGEHHLAHIIRLKERMGWKGKR